MKVIYCVETNEEYSGIAEAAKVLGVHAAHIDMYLRGKTETVKGYHLFVSKCLIRKVKCWETGVVYDDIASASKQIGRSERALQDCLYRKTYTCGGFRWYFADIECDAESSGEIRAEIWRKLEIHPSYSVSNAGRIRNDVTGKVLRGTVNKDDGYVSITFRNVKGRHSLHRLIAKSFIANPENKPEVNHKNGIKTDNRVDNLEWVTAEENREHAFNVLGFSTKAKPIKCVETNTVYKSIGEAGRAMGLHPEQFRKRFKKGTAVCGYHWKYADE